MDDYFLEAEIDAWEHAHYPYAYPRGRIVSRKRKFMAKNTIVFVKGTLYWPKIVGRDAAVPNYDGDGKEWTFELEPEDIGFLKEHRLLDRLKDPLAYAERLEERGEDEKAAAAREAAEGRGDYLLIRKPTETKDGEPTDPFRIYDKDNEPWGEDRLIGNGSKADVKLKIVNWGAGKKSSIYCMAIRITDHVPYETDEFAAMDNNSDDAPKSKPKKATTNRKADTKGKTQELDDLDDDIPF